MHLGPEPGKGARLKLSARVEERAESGRDRNSCSAYPSNRDLLIAEDEKS